MFSGGKRVTYIPLPAVSGQNFQNIREAVAVGGGDAVEAAVEAGAFGLHEVAEGGIGVDPEEEEGVALVDDAEGFDDPAEGAFGGEDEVAGGRGEGVEVDGDGAVFDGSMVVVGGGEENGAGDNVVLVGHVQWLEVDLRIVVGREGGGHVVVMHEEAAVGLGHVGGGDRVARKGVGHF